MVGSKDRSYNHCLLPREFPLGTAGRCMTLSKPSGSGVENDIKREIERLLRIPSAHLGMPADTKVFLRG